MQELLLCLICLFFWIKIHSFEIISFDWELNSICYNGGIIKTGERALPVQRYQRSCCMFSKAPGTEWTQRGAGPTRLGYRSFFPWQHVLSFIQIKLTFQGNCSAGFPPAP